jgi:plasmid maintenance system killer protein
VLTFNTMVVTPTNWLLQDMSGVFSMMVDQQFNAFFSLDTGGPATIEVQPA